MFGSTTSFGQSSNSPFGSPSVSGQNGNASNNQFIPKPCGSTTSFGSPTGGSMFYGTSTSIFGANSSSSESTSTSTFGAPLYSAFGSSSAPAFGSSSLSFGGSSTFGQKPVFGGFALNPNQSNSFWNSLPQNQTTFQSSPFGSSTSFGASTQNSSGSAHSPDFGAPISSHNCVSAFGFGTGGGAFGAGAPNTLEPSKTSVFGVSKDSSFGASRSPTFGTSSTTGFGFGTIPTFGQSISASGSSSSFGTVLSAFGDQNSFAGAQSTTRTFGTTGFGQSVFGSQHGGSRVAAYTATAEVDDGSSAAKLESISAMTINKDKSHEELRWEDYLSGDKGGIGGSTVQSSSFDPSPTLAQSPDNPFYSSTASNSVGPQISSTPFAPQSTTPTFETTGFGHLPFGSQHGGSRLAAYTATAEVDGVVSTQHAAKLQSISAMPINKDKSHEEFRWEDYQSGDKVGSSTFGQKPVFGGFASKSNQSLPQNQTTFQSSPFGSSTSFGASTQNSSGSACSPAFGAPISSHNCVAAFGFGTGGGAFGAGAPNTLEPSKASVFGVSKDSSFGSSRSPTFGTSSTTGFGFGTTPTLGQSTSASGSSSSFGTALSAFGDQNSFLGTQSTTPTFGTTGFGQSVFGSQHGGSRVAAYTATAEVDDGSSAAKLESISAMTINKDKSHEELRWEDYLSGDRGGPHCMGQSAGGIGGSTVQSSSFDPSPTLAQSPDNPFYSSTASNSVVPQTSSTPFGPQSTMPTFETTGFGHLVFGSQHGGSRVAAYTATAEVDGAVSTQHAAKLQSISAMPINKDKCHEEFRWEDYQSGDKGGPRCMSQSAGGIGIGGSTIHSNHICPPTSSQSSVNPFCSLTASNPFAHQTSSNPFATTVPEFSSSFFNKLPSANSFGTSSSSTTSPFVIVPAPAPQFGPLPSIFSFTASGFNSGLSSVATQSSPLVQSVAPFAHNFSIKSVANSSSQPNNFIAPSTECQWGGNLFSSTLCPVSMSNPAGFSQITPSFSSPSQPTQSAQTTDAFANRKFPQPSAGLSGVVGNTGVLGQKTFSQPSATQSSVALQPAPNVSPFGALPAMPPLSIGHPGSIPSIQYGISSMPVLDKPAASVRMPSLLTSRHLSQSRIRLPARKYDPKSDGPKVPFFRNDEEMTTTPKTDALFVPRENPRATVMANTEKRSSLVASLHVHKNGKISAEVFTPALLNGSICQDEDDRLAENSSDKEGCSSLNSNYKPIGAHNYNIFHKGSSLHIKTTGCKASEPTILREHVANVEPLMPQLARSEYYTKPQILELSVKERAEPGFCSHVKDFVVGRHGYGNIKFLGETDVRKLDLDSLVQFNTREVVVYMDEKNKPPVGQGLNKAADVTLYNVKCTDKKTGKEYINGPNVDKYRGMLIKKATEQGAEFVSYDPVEGEWKFRVKHFSQYKF
ncbi:Nuclear pore complex protein NUP98A [Camellia lanceoleosa]|uniref:Nuclear pore complex protein NUP98A n=1 Tax=Camellia lanceoleosa TaxID=1840588 RepID=A0ACC0I821_9ERIC|nr:Nuclear pore complex protein NUP98A [Camellia lanceoleosa]